MELKKITDVYIIWKETKRQLVKESTLATYMTNAEKHILPAFGNCTKVEDSAAQAFAFGLLERGLSPRTVKDIMLVLKMIVVFGYRKGWLEWHEWDIRLPKDDVHNELKILTHSEQKTMMNFLGSHFSFRNLGLYICLCTGMRIGEICALKWCDIDLDTRMISVNRTIERIYVVDGGLRATKVVIGRPKTASSRRDIPINNSLLRILRPLSRFICPDGYVLTNSEKPLEPRIADKLRETAGAAHSPPVLQAADGEARHAEDKVPRPEAHLRHAMHRKPVRLQDRKLHPRALEHKHDAQPLRPSRHGTEAQVH
ncbi:putative uncharacterized protein [Prevotella sp. CAG:1124]|nr:putative uncharacterized protein [Prevotella sp. CAG:1124]